MRRGLLVFGALALLGACGDDGGSAAEFCADVRANRDAILTPPADADEIDDFVGLHRRLGGVAPLAIEREWTDLVVSYETASTVEPGDADSVQRAVETAVRAERSVVTVRDWVVANCQVDLGDVATMRPPPTTILLPNVSPPDTGAAGG